MFNFRLAAVSAAVIVMGSAAYAANVKVHGPHFE